MMTTITLLAPFHIAEKVFATQHFERLATLGTVIDGRYSQNLAEILPMLVNTECIVTIWGIADGG